MEQVATNLADFQGKIERKTDEINKVDVSSPVLARLIEEVRNETDELRSINAYNRMHNRHNRSR